MSAAAVVEVFDAAGEYDRQVARLVDLGYPALTGRSTEDFEAMLAPLRETVLGWAQAMTAPTAESVPFVVVVPAGLVPAASSMPLTSLRGKPGFVSADTSDIDRFLPIAEVDVPAADAYLLLGVERGSELRDVRPNDALVAITARGRTPLTYDEGIALVTLRPEVLEKNHCFSLVASRCGDKRVPALWISGGAPKLGWCWAGNPHTWLGSASCAGRIGPDSPRPAADARTRQPVRRTAVASTSTS